MSMAVCPLLLLINNVLVDQGNKAFKAGNMQQAYMLYSACLCGMYSAPDATYWLNRAAVCLKLKAYVPTFSYLVSMSS